MGSVKDLQILKQPESENYGLARFKFSDRYSIFDWGEMPDHIPNKGASIAILGAYFFEKLEHMGIPSHYIGLVEGGEVKRLSAINSPVNTMEVRLLRVIKPLPKNGQYDYSAYKKQKGNFLIPLELIYRNYLPPGSSVFKRLKDGQLKPSDLGINKEPVPNQKLDSPILDVSTKLEITDRYLTWDEARRISGLSTAETEELKKVLASVNNCITDEFARVGLVNEDGKIEVGFDSQRCLILVDVLGTLDECRFTYDGMPVSKEIARIYYRKTPWFQAVEEAKKKNRQQWKEICKLSPEPLPPRLKDLISQVYCACTNEITGKSWFENIPPLQEILKEISRMS